jgi:hypothetical protein
MRCTRNGDVGVDHLKTLYFPDMLTSLPAKQDQEEAQPKPRHQGE